MVRVLVSLALFGHLDVVAEFVFCDCALGDPDVIKPGCYKRLDFFVEGFIELIALFIPACRAPSIEHFPYSTALGSPAMMTKFVIHTPSSVTRCNLVYNSCVNTEKAKSELRSRAQASRVDSVKGCMVGTYIVLL